MWAFWSVLVLMLAIGSTCAVMVWRRIAALRHTSQHDPRRLIGTATRHDVVSTASKKALLRRSSTLRPSLDHADAGDVGYLVGRSRGMEIWASVEDSILVLGPPRSGKGLHVVINAILDAPGAVVTTATRPDNIAATITARQERGPVAVFDPQRLAEGLPAGLRWSPVRGCEDPLTAMIRATGLASATGYPPVASSPVASGKARREPHSKLCCTPQPSITEARPNCSPGPVTFLRGRRGGDLGLSLRCCNRVGRFVGLDDPRRRPYPRLHLDGRLPCLVLPCGSSCARRRHTSGRRALRPNRVPYWQRHPLPAGHRSGSWCLVVTGRRVHRRLVETARRLAAQSPGARLDPPLLLALDEIGNLSPLPSLPVLMAEGGGTGITTMPVLQSLSQVRDKWGDHAAGAIWDASIVKIILGGTSSARDLQDLSALIGERDEKTDTISVGDYDPGPSNAPPGASRSCHPRPSAPCRSALLSFCCAARHRWSRICGRGLPGRMLPSYA